MKKDLGNAVNDLIVEISRLAASKQMIEHKQVELAAEIHDLLSARRSNVVTDSDSEDLGSFRFEFNYFLEPETIGKDWRGYLLDEEGYIVCEVWNNGDGPGNFYVWHNGEARWAIEAQAVTQFPPASKVEGAGKTEATELAPMDAWIAKVIGNARGNLGR